jgi:hypothetical protein
LKDPDRILNPVLSGRFQTILLALIRKRPEVLSRPEFRGFLKVIVDHIDLIAWQECLFSLSTDLTNPFYGQITNPNATLNGYRSLSDCARRFARAREFEKLHGLFSVLVQIQIEEAGDHLATVTSDPITFHGFSNALEIAVIGGAPKPMIQKGVRFIQIFLKTTQGVEVKRVHRAWSRAFCKRVADQSKIVEIFPAVWPGGIHEMWSMLLNEKPQPERFCRTIFKVLMRWEEEKPDKFEWFIDRHDVLAKIREAVMISPMDRKVREAEEGVISMNPWIFRLAALLSYGQYKVGKEKKRPLPIKKQFVTKYDEHNDWVVKVLVPYLELMIEGWNDASAVLKPI